MSRLNKYLSSTHPEVGVDVVRRGSCTCSTITEEDFILADGLLNKLLELDDVTYFDQKCQDIIRRLKHLIVSANMKDEIILFPSGSDAEFMPVIIALIRSAGLYSKVNNYTSSIKAESKVYNIVTAAGEVGSGTANACGGQHFSPISPRWGNSVQQSAGLHLEGLDPSSVEVKQFVPRNSKGEVCFNEPEIIEYINSKLASIPHAVVVVHMVCGSKTGLIYPSEETLGHLQQQWGERVIVVSDNCQLRCPLSMVKRFTAKGYITLLTGSKFFTGPPFSGAVVLPAAVADELESHLCLHGSGQSVCKVPVGLAGYISQHEVSERMVNLRKFLVSVFDSDWVNIGLHLRWACGLRMMEKYNNNHSEEDLALFAQEWTSGVVQLVQSIGAPHLEVLSSEMNIVSVAVRDRDGVRLTTDDLKEFHRRMLQSDGRGGVSVMLGQPVKVSSDGFAVVRIALGADMVVFAAGDSARREHLRIEDEAVVCRMRFLAANWSELKSRPKGEVNSDVESDLHLKLRKRLQRIDNRLLLSEIPLLHPNNNNYCFEDILKRVSKVGQRLAKLGKSPEVVVVYDLDALAHCIQSLTDAFASGVSNGSSALHCFAVKSCPLSHILNLVVNHFGLGLETASIGEVHQALRVNCPPHKIVFDSPCKTVEEISFALSKGIHVNANSFGELEKIKTVLSDMQSQGIACKSNIGLRINPMVGAGDIAALSTATGQSKFGVPLFSSESGDDANNNNKEFEMKIREAFRSNVFLNTIMCHVGSQGMSLQAMAKGVQRISELADLIDLDCSQGQRVKFVDIGGGLSVNYSDWSNPIGFKEYADLLLSTCPSLFSSKRVVVTEFGKSLVARSAVIASKIEDVLVHPCSSDKVFTAIGHCGADLLLRTAYCPDKFSHRVKLLDCDWKEVVVVDPSKRVDNCKVTIAGPLCFSGDNIITNSSLPQPIPGDITLILDAGANTLSMFSRHCSRPSPPVFGFRSVVVGGEEILRIEQIREQESIESLLTFWD